MGVGGNIVGQSGCQESIHDSGHYSNNYIEQFSEICSLLLDKSSNGVYFGIT